jgi:glycosyltransferase involved in cell wall biosynthesis
MFEGKRIAVVVPCYNEQSQIEGVLTTMPELVDIVYVVDDSSPDRTADVVENYIAAHDDGKRVRLIRHERNAGVGAALITGYKQALADGIDIAAVMAGDGQMDPDELPMIVGPVARGHADYVKGNRLFYRGAWSAIPRTRFLGNAFLSLMTKIASGYWHVADSQTGYTAIHRDALELIELDELYPSYGYPNDMLVRLNACEMRVADVYIRPVYNVGEQSKMKLWKVIPKMSWLIFRRFCWRLWIKYVIRDFHPLVLFYAMALFLKVAGVALLVRLIALWAITGRIPQINALMWAFCVVTSIQLALFAMWFDMEVNRDLCIKLRRPRPTPWPPQETPA